jgi:hypothetical protein
MFRSKKSIFDKINDYLIKKGHELVMSIYLNNYNGNNIYIRVDYIRKLSIYKVVWVDLNFLNPKKLDAYINSQMVTKYIAVKLIEQLNRLKLDSSYEFNDKIIGDRVEVVTYLNDSIKEYVFDRFLPLEWEPFIDLFAIVFSYLPRGMEIFLHEIFAKFDGTEERFNCSKPIKFDLLLDDMNETFRKMVVSRGEKIFEDDKVKFVERQEDDYYIGLVEEEGKSFVPIVKKVDDEHVFMHCNCKCDYYCKHIYAMIKSIRENKMNNFYKVRYIGKEESLLEKVTISNFYLCFGIKDGKLLLINDDGSIFPCDVIQKGKVAFEVLEDDDECSLSKEIEELKEK